MFWLVLASFVAYFSVPFDRFMILFAFTFAWFFLHVEGEVVVCGVVCPKAMSEITDTLLWKLSKSTEIASLTFHTLPEAESVFMELLFCRERNSRNSGPHMNPINKIEEG